MTRPTTSPRATRHAPRATLLLVIALSATARGQDANDAAERALKAAADRVAPCVVRIETSGGQDTVVWSGSGQDVRKVAGPTTGLAVDPDGYVVTSSFNFVNKPTEIFVTAPGKG